jgi:hypothetical protein
MLYIGRQFAKAGSAMGLPLLLLLAILATGCSGLAESRKEDWTFQEFSSSCIDLGHYDAKAKKLTVRFAGRNTQRFYRYSNVPPEVWRRLNTLNESGSVGNYLIETVVQQPKQYPFEELIIHSFSKLSPNRKAGDSK